MKHLRRRIATASVATISVLSLGAARLGSIPAQAAPKDRTDNTCTTANTRLQNTSPVAPSNLCVPGAATDDVSTVLVWNKPEGGTLEVVDYEVFQDGRSIGRANANAAEHTPSQEYVDAFYARDTDGFHVKVKSRSFKVTGLRANTTYEFTVRAVLADGTLSEASNAIRQTTAKRAQRLVVTQPQFGAVGDGITLNTKATQKAIDTCNSPNCTVVIPEGTFRTGALFLKSNMTLELAEGSRLLGSENWQDYPMALPWVTSLTGTGVLALANWFMTSSFREARGGRGSVGAAARGNVSAGRPGRLSVTQPTGDGTQDVVATGAGTGEAHAWSAGRPHERRLFASRRHGTGATGQAHRAGVRRGKPGHYIGTGTSVG